MKKKVLSLFLAMTLTLGLSVGLASCNNDKTDSKALAICLASEPATIDPALNSAVDGATLIVHLFSNLVKYDENLNLVADSAEALPTPTQNDNGETTYVFKLREGLKWSNGEPVLASDFEWSWKRAASTKLGADYSYMFEVIKGYDDENEDDLMPLAVTSDNANRTLSVTLPIDVPYFFELCAFPAYAPLYNREAHVIDDDGVWATDPETYICNGAYTIKEWKHNQYITLVKNPNYYDANKVSMEKINFYLSDDANTMLANYKKGDWLFIDDVPTEEIANLKADAKYKNEFYIGSQLGTYYISFNNNNNLLTSAYSEGKTTEEISLANAEVRQALGLLIDRDYICVNIGQAGQEPASSFVALGLTDPSNNNEQFYKHAGNSEEYVGYYDATKGAVASNQTKAVEILKKYYTYDESAKKFTDFPTFTYLYNTSAGHKAIAEYIQSAFSAYGINMQLQNQEWATFLVTRKAGNYGVARNGWLGDYNDPISFLDMWTSGSGNNDVQFGKYSDEMTIANRYNASTAAIYNLDLTDIDGETLKVNNGTWADTYDVLIAKIKSEPNTVKRYKLMHKAEDLLMETGDICPLYYYTDIYLCSSKLKGFFASPLGYKYFMYTTIEK